MTQEEKQLLLKDLSARLPYGVICSIYRIDDDEDGWRDEKLTGYYLNRYGYEFYFGESPICIDDNDISKIKPYLRPLSSMTEEEKKEFESFGWRVDELDNNYPWAHTGKIENVLLGLNWLNAYHFDYRGLIPMGLAFEVTKEYNPYECDGNQWNNRHCWYCGY